MKKVSKLALVALAVVTPGLSAQVAPVPEFDGRRVSVNVFRAPSTGLDYRISDHASAHAGLYPTVLRVRGERENVNFIRLGGTFWMRPAGSGFYFSPGIALSLERGDWDHSFANEIGYHRQLGDRWSARLGALLLSTVDLESSRINPTIGFSFRPGTRRLP